MFKPIVLFLCTGNYYRSRFAEILFNHLATESGSSWRAESRGLDLKIGLHNVGPLSPHTLLACQQRQLPVAESVRDPLPACGADFQRARLIVAVKEAEHRPLLEKLFPEWSNRVRYWHVHD